MQQRCAAAEEQRALSIADHIDEQVETRGSMQHETPDREWKGAHRQDGSRCKDTRTNGMVCYFFMHKVLVWIQKWQCYNQCHHRTCTHTHTCVSYIAKPSAHGAHDSREMQAALTNVFFFKCTCNSYYEYENSKVNLCQSNTTKLHFFNVHMCEGEHSTISGEGGSDISTPPLHPAPTTQSNLRVPRNCISYSRKYYGDWSAHVDTTPAALKYERLLNVPKRHTGTCIKHPSRMASPSIVIQDGRRSFTRCAGISCCTISKTSK